MGTVVLSPQDCLSSPHNRQNYSFSSIRRPKSDKIFSQAVMVQHSAAEDCARQDFSGGSPPQDGILPIPHLHGQARVLSKRPPFSSKTPSMCCTPLTRKTTTGSASPIVKPKLSRSASAILPTPLTGSPPNLEGDGVPLLKGRLPFKVVQGNGLGNAKVDVAHGNSLKKHLDTRHGTYKKTAAANMRTVNAKVVDGSPDGRPSKPVHDGADSKEKPKKVDARNQKTLERCLSGKGIHERHDQQIQTPSFTILQRPKNEEAAAELFAKFFQNSEGQDGVPVNEQVDCLSKKVDVHEMTAVSENLEQRSTQESSDSDSLDDGRCQITFSCSTNDVQSLVDKKFVGGSSVAVALKHSVLPTLASPIVETDSASRGTSKNFMLESVTEELAPWERWAGPSYINSPPPSALPLPRFSGIHMKNGSLATIDLVDDAVSDQAPTPPFALPALFARLSGKRQLCVNSDTVASATKDLRRILNLDFYRV